MARTKGSFSLAGAIEPKAAAPLDARSTVKTMAELTDANSFPYSYIGMSVFVTDPTVLKEYVLIGADTTVLANWREQGSGSSESPIIMNYATYQALPTETKNDGKVRYIPDYPSSGGGSDPDKADLTVIAPAFDSTVSYAIGDVVSYNGKVYTFTAAHTGAWDSADVDETDVSELTEEMSAAEVQAVKDAYDATALQTGAFASTFDIIDLRGTERIVGKLIESDGTEKVLYEKTIQTTSSASSSTPKYESIGNNCLIHSIDGYLEYSGDHCIPINFYAGVSDQYVSVDWGYTGKGQIRILTPNIFASKTLILTVRYTKTT